MPGELTGRDIVVSDAKEASQIYNKGYFGVPQTGGPLSLKLIEAAYLAESEKLSVTSGGKELGLEDLMKLGHRTSPNFEIKYIVYRDLRQRGYIVKPAEGIDFRLYPRGGIPSRTPSKYWVIAVSERAAFSMVDLAAHVKRVEDLRKELLLAVVDEESDITYYGVRISSPSGSGMGEAVGKKADGLLLSDRVMVMDRETAEHLHKSEFFGRMVSGKYLQLSLIESAYLLQKGVLGMRSMKTGKAYSAEKFMKYAARMQKDFSLRLRVYTDLKMRGIVVKTGFKYGAHFRGYEKDPDSTHARYLIHAVPGEFVSTWPEISRAVRLAHGVRKDIVFGRESGKEIEYIGLRRTRP